MKLSILSALTLVTLGYALPQQETTKAKCVKPYLCCGELKTPLDSTVDPILSALGINAAGLVGSIGLACKAYDETCKSGPKCCTEANLLGGTVALGCADLASTPE